jgi:hypothetical protein
MTTSHAPATIARTTIELIGEAMTTSRRARSALPQRCGCQVPENSFWLITYTVLIVLYRNLIQAQTSSAIRTANELYQSGCAVIASHALNSRCSHRLCARLARNRVIIVAGSPVAARRTCASGSIALLAVSATGLGQLAVVATPSRTRPTQNATGSIASIP